MTLHKMNDLFDAIGACGRRESIAHGAVILRGFALEMEQAIIDAFPGVFQMISGSCLKPMTVPNLPQETCRVRTRRETHGRAMCRYLRRDATIRGPSAFSTTSPPDAHRGPPWTLCPDSLGEPMIASPTATVQTTKELWSVVWR